MQAVACITHIQPCHPTTHITQICRFVAISITNIHLTVLTNYNIIHYNVYREDCIKLLSNCSKSDVAPQAVCDIIAPANTEKYCISISDYLSEL